MNRLKISFHVGEFWACSDGIFLAFLALSDAVNINKIGTNVPIFNAAPGKAGLCDFLMRNATIGSRKSDIKRSNRTRDPYHPGRTLYQRATDLELCMNYRLFEYSNFEACSNIIRIIFSQKSNDQIIYSE